MRRERLYAERNTRSVVESQRRHLAEKLRELEESQAKHRAEHEKQAEAIALLERQVDESEHQKRELEEVRAIVEKTNEQLAEKVISMPVFDFTILQQRGSQGMGNVCVGLRAGLRFGSYSPPWQQGNQCTFWSIYMRVSGCGDEQCHHRQQFQHFQKHLFEILDELFC